jgi:hypothetical protein
MTGPKFTFAGRPRPFLTGESDIVWLVMFSGESVIIINTENVSFLQISEAEALALNSVKKSGKIMKAHFSLKTSLQ